MRATSLSSKSKLVFCMALSAGCSNQLVPANQSKETPCVFAGGLVGLGVGVRVGEGEGVGVRVGDGDGVGVRVGEGDGVGV